MLLSLECGIWQPIRDADPEARAIFQRHYSYRKYTDGRDPAKFIGPGEYMALVTPHYDALFVWRKFINMRPQDHGVNCAIFRNESEHRSSDMIREAVALAWDRWPSERLYTYVNPRKIESPNPGYCFKCAGWSECGKTSKGLVVLELECAGYRAKEME